MKQVVVVGAGISGIIAATLEAKKGNKVRLIDSSKEAGGLLNSVWIDGAPFDYGTHLMSETGIGNLDDILFGELDFKDYRRTKIINASSYFNGRLSRRNVFIETNFLEEKLRLQGLNDLIKFKKKQDARNLSQWFEERFGTTFAHEVFCPVIKKLYGQLAHDLIPSLGYTFDLSRLLAFDRETTKELSSIPRFVEILGHHERIKGRMKWYPRKGGMGKFIEDLIKYALRVGVQFLPEFKIGHIKEKNGVIDEIHGEKENLKLDHLLWTIPYALLGYYAKSNITSLRPKFRSTTLFHIAFDKKLNNWGSYVNVHDIKLESARITLYGETTKQVSDMKRCTVEVLSDNEVGQIQIVDELMKIGLVPEDANISSSHKMKLPAGFPILTVDYVDKSKDNFSWYREKFKNVVFLGRGAESSFFTTDVLIDVYNKLNQQHF